MVGKISDFPVATTLDLRGRIEFIKGLPWDNYATLVKQLNPALLNPTPNDLFDTLMVNYDLQKDWRFGTSQVSSGITTAIKNVTDLAVDFNPYADFTNTTVINNECQRYQPFSDADNFIFGTDKITLRATLESGQNWDALEFTLGTSVNNSATVLMADTTGIQVGMEWAGEFNYSGLRYVTAVSTNTSVTLSGAVTLASGRKMWFLPCYNVTTTTDAVASAVLDFTAVPAGIVAGMVMCFAATSNSGALRRVVSTTSTTITLDTAVTFSSNTPLRFIPAVFSGQFWTKDNWAPNRDGALAVAWECLAKVPPGSKYGGWPASWLHKADDGTPNFSGDTSEIDNFETFNSSTSSSNAYTGNDHGTYADIPVFKRDPDDWGGNYYRPGIDYADDYHRFGVIWTPTETWRYIDGIPVVGRKFQWGSTNRGEIGHNLAVGALTTGFMGNFFFPRTSAGFPYDFDIKHVKVWTA